MIINGRDIAADIRADIAQRVTALGRTPRLTIFSCDPNFETRKYLGLKERVAREVGIDTEVRVLPKETTTEELVSAIEGATETDGIILQLPLPKHIATDTVIKAILSEHDIDALNPETRGVLPPVAEACREILVRHNVSVQGVSAVVVGEGRLVGRPVAQMLRDMGAKVAVLTHESSEGEELLKTADVIVSGAGDPGFIKPDMIKEGVVLLDAGTSEDGGVLVGDADPLCSEKAGLFTPVPGGIGPITVAVLLRNLIILAERCEGASRVV
ncbi:bifunctional 5,10-methylenetetrahydrofolate dehydrogenase/5,10-methenyltetrahydrofolate cyclohydrolase [Candidatus Kaiserbacteria bacterium]|nr:bifunctional 5,10-methylenetetrahydrofolate dehydrogenase/5,10-methenyltetrahydrofolate cyclohydrolase [Candidatus Kaiserbacteria bacterium]